MISSDGSKSLRVCDAPSCKRMTSQDGGSGWRASTWFLCEQCRRDGWVITIRNRDGDWHVVSNDALPSEPIDSGIAPEIVNGFVPVCTSSCPSYGESGCKKNDRVKTSIGDLCVSAASSLARYLLGYIAGQFG